MCASSLSMWKRLTPAKFSPRSAGRKRIVATSVLLLMPGGRGARAGSFFAWFFPPRCVRKPSSGLLWRGGRVSASSSVWRGSLLALWGWPVSSRRVCVEGGELVGSAAAVSSRHVRVSSVLWLGGEEVPACAREAGLLCSGRWGRGRGGLPSPACCSSSRRASSWCARALSAGLGEGVALSGCEGCCGPAGGGREGSVSVSPRWGEPRGEVASLSGCARALAGILGVRCARLVLSRGGGGIRAGCYGREGCCALAFLSTGLRARPFLVFGFWGWRLSSASGNWGAACPNALSQSCERWSRAGGRRGGLSACRSPVGFSFAFLLRQIFLPGVAAESYAADHTL